MALRRELLRIQPARNGIQYVVDEITREELKPIVFFDAGKFTKDNEDLTIGFHPHSGIGIITYFHGTDLHHKDSGNNNGVIHDGGAQWIRAGGGVWHEESYRQKHNSSENPWIGSIHQLWIQLPPEFEESEVEYANLSREELPSQGNVKVLAGEYQGITGKMNIPIGMTYLDINLKKGEEWRFDTPDGQTTGFIYVRDGEVEVGGEALRNSQMGVLEHNAGQIEVKGISQDNNLVLIISNPSNYPIVGQGSQIHTNKDSLSRSTERIEKIGADMRSVLYSG